MGRSAAALLLLVAVLLGGSATAVAQPADDTVADPETTTTTTTTAPAPAQGEEPTTTGPTTTRVTVPPPEPEPEPGADEPADEPEPAPEPDAPAPDTDDEAAPLPTGPPPGYTEQQFRTFVDVVEACGPDPGVVCSRLLAWTGNRTLAEVSQWFVEVPIRIAIVIALALLANWLVRRALERYLQRLAAKPADDDEGPDRNARRALRMATASTTLGSAATVIIFVVAGLVALAQLNINIGPLLAGAGIAGVALGFGAQNLVRDILAGFFVIVEDQYGIGDVINAGAASGTVEGISLRVTKLRDVEGTLWFIPNGIISEVGNMTQRWARVILDVDVAYGSNHHDASRLIKEAADAMWQDPAREVAILEEPEMWGVERLGDSAVTIRVAIKVAPADQWKAARLLRSRIKDRFDDEGIEIPFPQQTVWMRSADAQ